MCFQALLRAKATAIVTAMKGEMAFFRMLQSLDALFPIGAFTMSNGLEDYVLSDRLKNADDLDAYIHGFMQLFPYNDLGLVSLAWRYENNREMLLLIDGLADAMKGAMEVRNGSMRLGRRFMKLRAELDEPGKNLEWYQKCAREGKAAGLYPIALGIYGAGEGIDLQLLLQMFGYNTLSAIVNHGVKLVPLSPAQGQKKLYEALKLLEPAVSVAMNVCPEELGVCAPAMDIHCMNHEHLYSRQYMS